MESRTRLLNLNSHFITLSKGTWIRVAHFPQLCTEDNAKTFFMQLFLEQNELKYEK